jgi:putative iron-regulated protein
MLLQQNQIEGEKNICTGWHAIEFLLWGVDSNPSGPGNRPFTDFTEGPLASRRCDVLRGDAINLTACLDKLVAAWDPAASDNYRAEFIKTDAHETSRRVFTGVTLLVGDEMAGERLTVSLETRDQENEQSCFSDTTKQDLIHNLQGAKLVWEGKFSAQFLAETEVSGAGLRDLVKHSWDPAMVAVIDDAFAKAEKSAQELPELIDHAIGSADDSPERAAVVQTRDALEYLHAMFVALTARLGLVLPSTPLDG